MTKYTLERYLFFEDTTIGRLYRNDKFFCYTLEDATRTNKIKGETAIPEGTYPLKLTYSPKYKKDMPLIDDVPNFQGIRIHIGNSHRDTEGCILVGEKVVEELRMIYDSRSAFERFMTQFVIDANGEVSIEIENRMEELHLNEVRV